VRRPALILCSLAAGTVLIGGCGSSNPSPAPAAPSPAAPTVAPTSAAPSPAPSAAALPAGCTAPSSDVDYTAGTASFDVTAGPDQGHYDLTLDSGSQNAYAASDKEITGNWKSADGRAILFIDIEGTDPCAPDAFTKIGTQGSGGPVFIDGGHTDCKVKLPSLGTNGAQGSFTCSGLTGGGEGITRDAKGSFTLLP
jgi:hypothetical protein